MLCRLRLSSHNLHIETGRYGNKPIPKSRMKESADIANMFIWVMSQEDADLIQILAIIVRRAFQKREIYQTF